MPSANGATRATRGDAARARLLDVAERLFAERGIDAVSLNSIAREANQLNASVMQYHFASKMGVIEAILTHPSSTDEGTLREIQRYAKLFWINSGPYNNLTARKFVLHCVPEVFRAAVKGAVAAGAELPLAPGETADQLLDRLQPMFFDPDSVQVQGVVVGVMRKY